MTLQGLAEGFSAGRAGVLRRCEGRSLRHGRGGRAQALIRRAPRRSATRPTISAYPVIFWDLFGEQGHPIRTTISEMGPLLLSRLMDLNDTQEGVLNIAFKIADEEGLLLLDLKDLQALLDDLPPAPTLTTRYGNVAKATVGTVQRSLLVLEQQGASISSASRRSNQRPHATRRRPRLCQCPRRRQADAVAAPLRDLPAVAALRAVRGAARGRRPRQAEARLLLRRGASLFNDAPKALLEKVEQVVRLIRSKGVGVYFVTQNPLDIPDTVSRQLGNRIQHALRAFTPASRRR